jgi:AraC family transcriptional regulator
MVNNEYLSRLNRTIDYIQQHSHEDLNLEKLADVACFSKYHFHRVFKAILGETVNEFVMRIRLEKAWAQLMLHKYKPITDIALDTGFSSSQNFARSFKAQYEITPSQARAEYNYDTSLKNMQRSDGPDMATTHPDAIEPIIQYTQALKQSLEKRLATSSEIPIEIKTFPPYRVAYIRSWGPYDIEALRGTFNRLLQWAEPRGYVNDDAIVLGVAWNSTYTTPPEKLIYDACITVPAGTVADRWINIQTLQGGDFAVHHCDPDVHRHEEEWMKFLLYGLAKSDYQPDDRPAFTVYYPNEETMASTTERVVVDLCLPIKPLLQ